MKTSHKWNAVKGQFNGVEMQHIIQNDEIP